jgi:hypothetical protein
MLWRRTSGGTSVHLLQYSGSVKTWVDAERRSDLKEEASDLRRQDVAAKTRESERERDRHKMELYH